MEKKTSTYIKRVLLLLLSILIPVLLNGIHTWISAQEDEILLDDVYNRQIETALFTANQEINKLILYYSDQVEQVSSNNENGSLKAVYKIDSQKSISIIRSDSDYSFPIDSIQQKIKDIDLAENPIQVIYSTDKEVFFYINANQKIIVFRKYEFLKNDIFPLLAVYLTQSMRFELVDKKTNQLYVNQGFIRSDLNFVRKSVWILPNLELRAQVDNEVIESLRIQRTLRGHAVTILIGFILISSVIAFYRIWLKEQKMAQLKTDFVANVSHELKTPIALIRMNAETLGMGRVTDEKKQKHYLKVIEQESERLSHLINNVLNFSKLETGKKTFQLSAVSLNDRIQQVLNRYQSYIDQKGFELKLDLAESLPMIKADPNDMDEILINLIDNAIKYSQIKKEISLKTLKTDKNVIFEISDFGIGISKENQKNVFLPFYRVEDSLTQQTKGTGLGLSLVKEMLDGIGASIRVVSELGKGSTFTIEFLHL